MNDGQRYVKRRNKERLRSRKRATKHVDSLDRFEHEVILCELCNASAVRVIRGRFVCDFHERTETW